MSITISKCLGYGIILGAVVVKVPQIINILKAKSAEGLSDIMYYLEIFVLNIQISYGIHTATPFSVYGETIFLNIQSVIIVLLIWTYSKTTSSSTKLFWLTLLAGQGAYLFFGTVPEWLWDYLTGSINILNIISRSP